MLIVVDSFYLNNLNLSAENIMSILNHNKKLLCKKRTLLKKLWYLVPETFSILSQDDQLICLYFTL